MKNKLTKIIITIITIILLSSFATATTSKYYDFESDTVGNVPNNFTEYLASNEYLVSSTTPISGTKDVQFTPGNTGRYEYLVNDDNNFVNGSISASFKLDASTNTQVMGVFMRKQSNDDHYFGYISASGARFEITKYIAGVKTDLVSQAHGFSINDIYHIKFIVNGTNLNLSWTGSSTGSIATTDSTYTTNGSIGIKGYDGTGRDFSVDNVNITNFKEEAPLTSYFKITAKNTINQSLTNFTAIINTTKYNTTNGTIITNYKQNESEIITINISSIENEGYQNKTITGINTSTDYEVINLFQSMNRVYVKQKITNYFFGGSNETKFNITDDFNITNTSFYRLNPFNNYTYTEFYTLAGNRTYLFNRTGWFSKKRILNVIPLINVTNFIIENITNSQLNITAQNGYNLNNISNFTGWITNSDYSYNESFTTTNGTAQIYLIKNLTYKIFVNAPNYGISNETNYQNIIINQTYNKINFGLYSNNSILIKIRDEGTGLFITSNISITITGNSTENIYYTATGTYLLYNLTDGEYNLKFSGANYTIKSYTVTVAENSTQTLNAYLTESTDTTTFTVKETGTDNTIAETTFQVSRLINNSWRVILSKLTDVTGRVQFTYTPNVRYRFYLTKTDYEDKTFDLDPILFDVYTIRITKSVQINDSPDYSRININYEPKEFYNDVQNNLSVYFSSPQGVLTYYKIIVKYPGGTTNASGNNANGETFQIKFNITGATNLDKVNITINYKSTFDTGHKTYFYTYEIMKKGGIFGTAITNKNNPYGLSVIDRIIIITFTVIIMAGLGVAAGGSTGAGISAAITLGYYLSIGYVERWLLIIPITIIIILIGWRGSR